MVQDFTTSSPSNLLVNGGFSASTVKPLGWTETNCSTILDSGEAQVWATSAGGGLSQVVSGLEPSKPYTLIADVDGGSAGRAFSITVTGGSADLTLSGQSTTKQRVWGVAYTDSSGSLTVSLLVTTSGTYVTFDNVGLFTGEIPFAAVDSPFDAWRHVDDVSAIDGGEVYDRSLTALAQTHYGDNRLGNPGFEF